MSLHPSYAVSTDREPLGLLDAWMWARKPKNANGQRRDINESLRWIESYERLAERAVSTSAQIVELIEWYLAHWEIEMLFHVLKNGCRVEALQLALEAIERALTLFMVVSWRIARLMWLGRTCPELPDRKSVV